MNSAVILSVKPKWCAKIISGEKTVELRKTIPNLMVPFKVYIYCSKGQDVLAVRRADPKRAWIWKRKDVDSYNRDMVRNGQIVGEFVCDEIREIGFSPYNHGEYICMDQSYIEQSCVPFDEMFEYFGEGYGYGWHISELKIYDRPKELSEFWKDKCTYNDDGKCTYGFHCFRGGETKRCGERIEKAPQSWCYASPGKIEVLSEELRKKIERMISEPVVHIDHLKDIAEFIKERSVTTVVVRCKNCEHYLAGMCMRKIGPRNSGFKMDEDDYCSRGVRK
ncbi:MAG: hypothetical protein IJD35_00350 [Clostridia bacterium]|nr:hypothetical protein [Clostridia bacterium]